MLVTGSTSPAAAFGHLGIDFAVLPRADRHPFWMGDMLRPEMEFVAGLTGYTGYVGTLIVGAKRSLLRVDRMHINQAQQEVSDPGIDIAPIEEPWSGWLVEQAIAVPRIGVDPWLVNDEEWLALENLAASHGGRLAAIDIEALLPSLWPERPAPRTGELFSQPLRFTGESVRDKIECAVARLEDEGVDAALVHWPDCTSWLLNLRGAQVPCTPVALASAIIDRTGGLAVFSDAERPSPPPDDRWPDNMRWAPLDTLPDVLGEPAHRSIWIDPRTPRKLVEAIRQGGCSIHCAPDPLHDLKILKTPAELEGARQAHHKDGVAMAKLLSWLAARIESGEALSELEIADETLRYRREQPGFFDLSFPTIAGLGPNAALPHYQVSAKSNRMTRPIDVLLLDSGVQYLEGTTDVTRTILIGDVPRDWRVKHTIVAKAMIRLSLARFPHGASGAQLDMAARQVLWNQNYDYPHNTGHTVGAFLSAGEGLPRIGPAPRGDHIIQPTMIVSNEPAWYVEGVCGFRTENLMIATEANRTSGYHEFETLTLVPIDPAFLEFDLLDRQEIAWLNHYHRRVFDEIGPHLSGPARAWLRRATRQIG